ncbi:MAG: hypothetical protein RAK17_03835 [Caldisphaera sp.]|nr:hypothetical protein [Caldisphaera sp.]
MSQVRSLLSPINDALNAQIIFLAAIYAIYYMVKIMGNFILLIGLVLYSIPFRLSRDAGAWFISFILVFSIGLQVMPVFLVNFAQSSNSYTNNQGIDMGLTYVNARVLDENNEPIPGSLIYVYVNQNNSLNQIALYKTNDLGIVYSPDYNYDSLISLPSQVSSYIWGEEDGVAYKLFPYPLDSSDISFNGTINQVTLYAPNILYVNKYYTIVFTNGNSFKLNQIGNKILIYGNSSNYVEIRFLKGCIANLSYVNATLTRSSWSWEKLNGLSYRFVPLENENALITFQLNLCKSENLSAKYDDYAMNYLSLNNLLSPSLIENIILYYLTVPLIYFSLLVSITYGLSRLLGGRRGIIPRVI